MKACPAFGNISNDARTPWHSPVKIHGFSEAEGRSRVPPFVQFTLVKIHSFNLTLNLFELLVDYYQGAC
jgi:hypothetical protein